MAKSVLYMSMSLDGFITGPRDGPGDGLGTGGDRLHEWLDGPVADLAQSLLREGLLEAPGVTHRRYRVAS